MMNHQEKEIYDNYYQELCASIDVMFSRLLIFEWVLSISLALFFSPLTWDGNNSSLHPHVYMAFFFGGLLTWFPVYHIYRFKGSIHNKYIVCVAQMFFSTLLIHLTGGRIETHFHIFGSLAFLAFYRDMKVILLATTITAADHFLRGAFISQSIYGVASASYWRAFEHSIWVVFEDIFLLLAIKHKNQAYEKIAIHEIKLQKAITDVEVIVQERTAELIKTQTIVNEQQQSLAYSARLSALGEMAAGVAHEINNPLAIIASTSQILRIESKKGPVKIDDLHSALDDVDKTVLRISNIITGLSNVSRDSSKEVTSKVLLKDLFTDVLSICSEKMRNKSIEIRIEDLNNLMQKEIHCQRVQLSQVLLNLITNAHDAITDKNAEGWIQISIETVKGNFVLKISDSGPGVPDSLRQKIFQPFFTTKEVGKGTGLGLSLSRSIVEKHGGKLELSEKTSHTQFVVSLPDAA